MTYQDFINGIIAERGQWNEDIRQDYCERHHILLKCLGGEPQRLTWAHHPNVIWLTAQEHFIAHKLLAEENPDNKSIVFAWSMMAFPKGKTNREIEITPEEYASLRKLCSEQISKDNPALKNGHPWNYGLTKDTDERLKKVSDNSLGVNTWCNGLTRSEETRKKMSEAVKNRYKEHPESFGKSTKNKKAIHNGEKCIYINKDAEIPLGYELGSGKHLHYEIKNPEECNKKRSEAVSGDKNPMYGHGERVAGKNNGHAIYIYNYLGVDYFCRDDLMTVLKEEFPDISESAIRSIQKGNYGIRIIKKYQKIIDNLSWRLKDKYKIENEKE